MPCVGAASRRDCNAASHGVISRRDAAPTNVAAFNLQYPNAASWHDPHALDCDNASNTCL